MKVMEFEFEVDQWGHNIKVRSKRFIDDEVLDDIVMDYVTPHILIKYITLKNCISF